MLNSLKRDHTIQVYSNLVLTIAQHEYKTWKQLIVKLIADLLTQPNNFCDFIDTLLIHCAKESSVKKDIKISNFFDTFQFIRANSSVQVITVFSNIIKNTYTSSIPLD